MKKTVIKLLCLALAIVFTLSTLVSCAIKVKAEDLMEGITPREVIGKSADDKFIENEIALSLSLLRAAYATDQTDNVMLSPLSIQLALAMTANGAEGETLSQMSALLGGDIPLPVLNEYLYSYVNGLPSSAKYKLAIANSIWFRDGRINVERDFLQTNADYYGAAAYRSPFDKQTVRDINRWVDQNTDGMIDNILDTIPESALMYLINAVMFDAEWQRIYEDTDIYDGYFTTEDGQRQKTELMRSGEGRYIETEGAVGFVKNYNGGKYAFAALLPDEGISLSEYISSLSAEELKAALDDVQYRTVIAHTPKFSYEYSLVMNDVLIGLGMTDAFVGSLADFDALGKAVSGYNIYISEVIHKTYISVDERGTRAGAVTMVGMDEATSAEPTEIITIKLDRPFLYMIIDTSTNIPIFIGTLDSIE